MHTCSELRQRGTVGIAGGGPAGLTLARLLQRRGFAVRVYERDSSATARPQGGSLDLATGSGEAAMQQAGLAAACAAVSRPDAQSMTFLSAQGQVMADAMAPVQAPEATGAVQRPEIDRGDLRRLLVDSLAPGTIAWGHALDDVLPEAGGGWRLHFGGHPAAHADLVVGCDGVRSRVRRRLSRAPARYYGLTMLDAVVRPALWRDSALARLLGEGAMQVAGGGQAVWVQRCARDVIHVYFSMAVPESWPADEGFALSDTPRVLAAIAAAYSDWAPHVLGMLTQVEGGFARWPLYVVPPEQPWRSTPGLTMLGDAAHAMPPFTGRGINLALLDALELARGLTAAPEAPVATVLAAFEARLRARTRVETAACLARGQQIYGIAPAAVLGDSA